MGHGSPEQDEEVDERGRHQGGNAKDPARGERLHVDELQERLAAVREKPGQPGTDERVGDKGQREHHEGRSDVSPRGLQQEQDEDDPDHDVAASRIVNHGHAGRQPVILDDVVATAPERRKGTDRVEPATRPRRAKFLGLGG